MLARWPDGPISPSKPSSIFTNVVKPDPASKRQAAAERTPERQIRYKGVSVLAIFETDDKKSGLGWPLSSTHSIKAVF